MNLPKDCVIRYQAREYFGSIPPGDITITVEEIESRLIPGLDRVFWEGKECKVLLEGRSCQSGKFRIAIEFLPDMDQSDDFEIR